MPGTRSSIWLLILDVRGRRLKPEFQRASNMEIAMKANSLLIFVLLVALSGADDVHADCAPACSGGPGTEMTRMINRVGLGADCGRCKALANQMDQCGPCWVQQNKEYVVARTVSNAQNLGHRMGPIRRMGVRTLVNRAVRLSR